MGTVVFLGLDPYLWGQLVDETCVVPHPASHPLHGQPTQSCEFGRQASQKQKHLVTAMTTEPW